MNKPTNATGQQITYKQKMSGADLFRYVKAVAFPLAVFVIALIAIQILQDLAQSLLPRLPVLCGVWV